jgi:hypothetical protein
MYSGLHCTSLKPWRRKSKGMSEGREMEKNENKSIRF